MGVSGGIEGLHFVNTMSNTDLKRKAAEVPQIIGGMGRNINKLAPFAPLAIGGVILGKLGKQAHDFSNDFSKAMREVQTISKTVQEDFEGMGDIIVNMASTGPDNAVELAEAYYQIVSAGYDGARGLELLDVASRSATAGITDTKTAADGLTTILNAWKMESSEAEKVADAMFKTVEKGKTTFPELAQNIATVAPMASAMNISLEEVLGSIATLTKQGNPTSVAVTQIRQAIIGLNENLGDGWSKTMTFQEGLQAIRDRAGDSDTKLKEMMGRVEGVNAVLSLTGDKAVEASEDLDSLTNSVDAMQKAYDTMMKEADNKWSTVHNKWQRELKGIGDMLKTTSTGWADLLNALLTNESDLGNQAPLIGSFQDRVAGQKILGKNSIDAWFASIFASNSSVQTRLWEVFQKGQAGFGEKEGNLSKLLGIEDAKQRATELTKFLDKMVQERDSDLEVKSIGFGGEAVYKARQRNWESLILLIEDAVKKAESLDKGGSEPKPWSPADSIKKIEELEGKLGTGDSEFEIQLHFQIANEQEKLQEFANNFREKFTQAINESWQTPFNRTTDASGKNSKQKSITKIPNFSKEVKGQLQPMKQLTAEEEKRLRLQGQQLNKLQLQQELYMDISTTLGGTAQILGALSFATGELNSDLGETVGRMADIAGNASNMVASLAIEGPLGTIGAISSGIGMLGNIIGLIGGGKELSQSTFDSYEDLMSVMDQVIDKQRELLSTLAGNEAVQASQAAVEIIKKQTEATKELAKDYLNSGSGTFSHSHGYKEAEKLKQYTAELAKLGINLSSLGGRLTGIFDLPPEKLQLIKEELPKAWAELDDKTREYLDNIIESPERIKEIENQLRETLTSLSFDSARDSLRDLLLDADTTMADVAGNFEDYMRKAIVGVIVDNSLSGKIQDWYNLFAEAMSDGELAASEQDILQTMYENAYTNAEKMRDQAYRAAGLDDAGYADQSGLQGISRDLTEETGTLIAGQFMAMQEKMSLTSVGIDNINHSMIEQLSIATDSLEVLEDIRASGEDRNETLDKMVRKLDRIDDGIRSGLRV